MVVVSTIDYVDQRQLHAQRWDGSQWSLEWSTGFNDWNQRFRRAFGLEYEQITGNAMVVYSDDNSEIKYNYYNGSNWTGETEVYSGSPINGTIRWATLASKPGTNEIACAYMDSNSDLYVVIWDGTQWLTSDAIEVETNVRTQNERCFDLAYETLSGDLLVAWGRNDNSGIYFRSMPNGEYGNWTSKQRYMYNNHHQPEFLELTPDPASDKIACTHNTRDGHVHGAIWLGSGWAFGTRLEYAGGGGGGDAVTAIEWVGTTGKLVGIYDDNIDENALHWFTWTESESWIVQTDVSIPQISYIESVLLNAQHKGTKFSQQSWTATVNCLQLLTMVPTGP